MKWHSSHQQLKIHYLWFGDQLVGIRDECNEEHTHTRYWHYDGWDLLAQQFIESDDHNLTKVRTDWAVSDPTALPLRFYNQTGQLTWQSPKRTLWGKAYQAHDELGLNELRFAGQQYDAESGLCYNRFRYYHPDSGCYLSPDPLGLQGGLNTHAYVPNPTGWVDPLGLAGCKDAFKVAKHGDMPSPRPGLQSHHGVMSAWMKQHFPGYNPNKAPAVLMPEANHRATFGVYNTWRAEMRTKMGGTFDWAKVSESEIKNISGKMFDAAKVPASIRTDYWSWYSKMTTALSK